MKRSKRQTAELEAELLRLNTLVRQRRQQLARLEDCPHKDCECRQVWKEVVESKLATQMGKISHHVRRNTSARRSKTPKRGRRSSG